MANDSTAPFALGSATWPGLSKLVEECGEVLQVAGKLMATGGDPKHWDGTDLRERITEELADLQAAIIVVSDLNNLHWGPRVAVKVQRFLTWHHGEEIENV